MYRQGLEMYGRTFFANSKLFILLKISSADIENRRWTDYKQQVGKYSQIRKVLYARHLLFLIQLPNIFTNLTSVVSRYSQKRT